MRNYFFEFDKGYWASYEYCDKNTPISVRIGEKNVLNFSAYTNRTINLCISIFIDLVVWYPNARFGISERIKFVLRLTTVYAHNWSTSHEMCSECCPNVILPFFFVVLRRSKFDCIKTARKKKITNPNFYPKIDASLMLTSYVQNECHAMIIQSKWIFHSKHYAVFFSMRHSSLKMLMKRETVSNWKSEYENSRKANHR